MDQPYIETTRVILMGHRLRKQQRFVDHFPQQMQPQEI